MISPFDFVSSISFTKKNLLEDNPESEYNPFIVNRSLSYFKDTLFYSNEMNKLSDIPKKLQYDYLRLSIWKAKRFSKWHKVESSEDVKIIQEYYQCNFKRAENYLKILTEEQLNNIKASFNQGG